MTANPYSFGSLGERWTDKQATTIPRLNTARIKNDSNRWSLQQIMADPDDSTSALLIGIASTITPPSAVKSAESAKRIIPVMLDDPGMVWDLQAALQQARHRSWWASLGAPPVHGAIWIEEDGNAVVWWNLDTDAQYVQITGAASGIIDDATPALTGVDFLDFKILLSGTGGAKATLIDLLRDGAHRHGTAGHEQYKATLGDFTGTAGWQTLTTSRALVNDTVNTIAAGRDPSHVDEFGRPKHWWIAMTGAGSSTFNPVADAIYDGTGTGGSDVVVASNGQAAGVINGAADWVGVENLLGISADGSEFSGHYGPTIFTFGQSLGFWTSAVSLKVAILEGAGPDGIPLILVATDEGLDVIGHRETAAESSHIYHSADFVSPLMKGDRRAAWPLHSTADVSGASHTLTNNNTVTFSDGGPAGSYANFVAASSQTLSLADHADFGGMSELTVVCWLSGHR